MPPMRTRPTPEFVALWVEDGAARVWHIDVATGAADEIARLNVEGVARPDVLDLVRHMVRMRYGLQPRAERMADMPQAVLPTPAPLPPRRPSINVTPIGAPKYPSGAPKRSRQEIDAARERANELIAYVAAHPGLSTEELSAHMAAEGKVLGGRLGNLVRWGRAELRDGKWYATATNGAAP